MISVKVRFSKYKFDVPRFRQDVYEECLRIVYESIRAWFLEVIQHVPVATGMAKSSLTKLKTVLNTSKYLRGLSKVPLDINPTRTGPWARQRLAQGPDLSSDPPFVIVHSNQFGISGVEFVWENFVPHWYFLERFTNPTGGQPPWLAITQGNEALLTYLEIAVRRRIPRMKNYLIKEDIEYI